MTLRADVAARIPGGSSLVLKTATCAAMLAVSSWAVPRPATADDRAASHRLRGDSETWTTIGVNVGHDAITSSNLGDHEYSRASAFAELQWPLAERTSKPFLPRECECAFALTYDFSGQKIAERVNQDRLWTGDAALLRLRQGEQGVDQGRVNAGSMVVISLTSMS